MKKNDQLIGNCIDYTYEGLGVVKVNDFIFFVKNVLIDEEIEFIVTKLNKNYGYGRLVKIIKQSANRVDPFCVYYGKCGGCQLQHMSYQEQLRFKTRLVQNNMDKLAGINKQVKDTLGCVYTSGYRNKAQFPIRIEEGNVQVGFYRIHSNNIIDLDKCAIQSDLINTIMMSVKKFLKSNANAHDLRHLLIKHAISTNEVMVVLVSKKRNVPGLESLVSRLTMKHSEIKSVVQNINKRHDNVILADEEILLYGKSTIVDQLNEMSFIISSRSFYQVNPEQTKVLYDKVLQFADINENDIVIDLYCGVGTISLFLAKKAKKVIGIEIIDAAIENAKINAQMNHIDNVQFICSDAATYAQSLVEQKMKPDVVVVDPPRKGCDDITLDSICTMNPIRIVYVSCNPATLARDLKKLEIKGYQTAIVQPCDMFPNSFHIETIVLIQRKTM